MKKIILLLAMVFAFGLSTVAMNVEAAKRMGSGKSLGRNASQHPTKRPRSQPLLLRQQAQEQLPPQPQNAHGWGLLQAWLQASVWQHWHRIWGLVRSSHPY